GQHDTTRHDGDDGEDEAEYRGRGRLLSARPRQRHSNIAIPHPPSPPSRSPDDASVVHDGRGPAGYGRSRSTATPFRHVIFFPVCFLRRSGLDAIPSDARDRRRAPTARHSSHLRVEGEKGARAGKHLRRRLWQRYLRHRRAYACADGYGWQVMHTGAGLVYITNHTHTRTRASRPGYYPCRHTYVNGASRDKRREGLCDSHLPHPAKPPIIDSAILSAPIS
ncbi:hypothetical protein GGS23DRAFT_609343, partial [Durotheca rogersii]|uniref:uncharacterized protein n=1 Tax=Durotheca rogersii TaxID=419775 RepID=UPI00221F13F9